MGVVERSHRHVVDSGLALLNHASLPLTFWSFASAAAVFTYNSTPTDVLAGDSPYQKLFQKSPNIRDLRVFGCLAYPNLRPFNRAKFSNRTSPHVFIGYPYNSYGYLYYNPITDKILTSRDVVFLKNDFTENKKLSGSPISSLDNCKDPTPNIGQLWVISNNSFTTLMSSPRILQPSQHSQPSPRQQTVVDRPVHSMITRAKVGTRCLNPKYALQISATPPLLQNIKMALDSPQWKKAMIEELNVLQKNNTWTMVPRTNQRNILNCKWIFKLKLDDQGNIARHKARLVTNGMWQIEGVDVQLYGWCCQLLFVRGGV